MINCIVKFKKHINSPVYEGVIKDKVLELGSREFKYGDNPSMLETGSVSKYVVRYVDENGVGQITTIYPTNIIEFSDMSIKDKVSYEIEKIEKELKDLQSKQTQEEYKGDSREELESDIDRCQAKLQALSQILNTH